jgi:hypothetical protein
MGVEFLNPPKPIPLLRHLATLHRHPANHYRHPANHYRHPGLDPGSLRTTADAATGNCGSEPAMTVLFYRRSLDHTVVPLLSRHPGLDPGSLRTTDGGATGDCGSEPAMTVIFYRCLVNRTVTLHHHPATLHCHPAPPTSSRTRSGISSNYR